MKGDNRVQQIRTKWPRIARLASARNQPCLLTWAIGLQANVNPTRDSDAPKRSAAYVGKKGAEMVTAHCTNHKFILVSSPTCSFGLLGHLRPK